MPKENQDNPSGQEGQDDGIDNSAWKNDSKTQKLIAEINDLKKKAGRVDALETANTEREAAEQEATRQAEIKKAESEKRYEDAGKLKDEAHKKEMDALKSDLVTSNLRSELAVAGFEKRGVDLIANEYNAEKFDSIADYVKAAVENKDNAPFLGKPGRTQFVPPSETNNGGGTGTLTNEQIRSLQKSEKQEDRLTAQKYLEKYYSENKSFPAGFSDG